MGIDDIISVTPWWKRWWRWLWCGKRERRHRAGTLRIPSPSGMITVPSDKDLREALREHPPTKASENGDKTE